LTALADEGAIVFNDRMAGYEAERTLERLSDAACERQFMAGCRRPDIDGQMGFPKADVQRMALGAPAKREHPLKMIVGRALFIVVALARARTWT
jgi:hypothetical protein